MIFVLIFDILSQKSKYCTLCGIGVYSTKGYIYYYSKELSGFSYAFPNCYGVGEPTYQQNAEIEIHCKRFAEERNKLKSPAQASNDTRNSKSDERRWWIDSDSNATIL